jgi:hypothetical protein
MRKLLQVAGAIILAASLTIMVSGCGDTPCHNDGGIKYHWQIGSTIYYTCNDNTTTQVTIEGGGQAPDD